MTLWRFLPASMSVVPRCRHWPESGREERGYPSGRCRSHIIRCVDEVYATIILLYLRTRYLVYVSNIVSAVNRAAQGRGLKNKSTCGSSTCFFR